MPQLSSNLHFTRNLTHTLPIFKGLAHERPIKFLTDFSLGAFALVGTNSSALLQMIHQSLADGALLWFGHIQKSVVAITTWDDFKLRFYERYRTPEKMQIFRTELRLLFEKDHESTSDFFDRLKLLLIEIDPSESETLIKHKFLQRLHSDIRSRFNIVQQKLDDQIKIAALRDARGSVTLPSPSRPLAAVAQQQPQTSPHVAADDARYANATTAQDNRRLLQPSRQLSISADPSAASSRKSSRWWCDHCQRPDHSWERCNANPARMQYRPDSGAPPPPSILSNIFSENSQGR